MKIAAKTMVLFVLVALTGQLTAGESQEVGQRFRDCPECPEMVVVPAGSFMMGSPDTEEGRNDWEGPVHRVTIGMPFAVGVYEVTVSEFGRFVDETGHIAAGACNVVYLGLPKTGSHRCDDYHFADNVCYVSDREEGFQFSHRARIDFDWRDPSFGQGGDHPVVCVSSADAKGYVSWLSSKTGEDYRLPSEAEWEYAARAGTRTSRWWGERESGHCANAHRGNGHSGFHPLSDCSDGHARTAPVGSFRANAWGLHDVLGNVSELTGTCWSDSYQGAPRDGSLRKSGDCGWVVKRGGGWDDYPRNLRSAFRVWHRDWYTPSSCIPVYSGRVGDSATGFRVVRTL